MKEQTLEMKVPHSILKASRNSYDTESLGSVFQSGRDTTNDQAKKVDFYAGHSETDQYSVYDSQRHLAAQSESNFNSRIGSSALKDSSMIKNNRHLNKFLKTHQDSFDESMLDMETLSKLKDKMLVDFPVFALNDDYLKALGYILQDKINLLKEIINDFETKV